MNQEILERMRSDVKGFRLPRYQEIPGIGLYLEQTTKYISECLAPLTDEAVTGSMISNYVKRHLVNNPVRKQYSREQIARLIYIATVKTVLSMDDVKLTLQIQESTYEPQVAYDYFCCEFENILEYVFGFKPLPDAVGHENTDAKIMLRNTIVTVAHKVYLDKLFRILQKTEQP